MMKLSSITFILTLVPILSNACMYPNHGDTYNNLIKLEKLEAKNLYKVSMPRIISESNGWPSLTLIYSSHELEDGCKEEALPDGSQIICLPKDEIRTEVTLNSFWDKVKGFITAKALYEGKLQIDNKVNYSVELSVLWQTEVCLTSGHKVIIE